MTWGEDRERDILKVRPHFHIKVSRRMTAKFASYWGRPVGNCHLNALYLGNIFKI